MISLRRLLDRIQDDGLEAGLGNDSDGLEVISVELDSKGSCVVVKADVPGVFDLALFVATREDPVVSSTIDVRAGDVEPILSRLRAWRRSALFDRLW